MEFSEWLYAELTANNIISSDRYTVEDMKVNLLLTETPVTTEDLDDYWAQYVTEMNSDDGPAINDIGEW